VLLVLLILAEMSAADRESNAIPYENPISFDPAAATAFRT